MQQMQQMSPDKISADATRAFSHQYGERKRVNLSGMQIFYKQQGLPKRSPKEDAQTKRGYVDVHKGLMCRKTKVFHQQSVALNTPEES